MPPAGLLVLLVVGACDRKPGAAERGGHIVVSGDTAGWIVPCGCASNQSGGLPRRGTYVAELRKKGEAALVDAGGAPGGDSEYQKLKFEALLVGTKQMGLAAHNVGAAEARLGPTYLRETGERLSVPFVSANTRDADGQAIAPASRIARIGGVRVLIVGVLSAQLAPTGWQVEAPREAILRVLGKERQPNDFVLVLAYAPEAELRELATGLPEVDAVVGGPTGQTIPPQQSGPTLLTSATNEGKFLVELEVRPKRAPRAVAQVIELSDKYADHAAQKQNLTTYLGELGRRDFAAEQTGFALALPAGMPAEFRVAGAESCKECHEAEWRTWHGINHSAAWQSLKDRGYHVDPYCQRCHTTGYGLPGGFVSVERSADRVNVGCENCHGPSAAHVREPKVHTPYVPADQCIRCHDRENSPHFEHEPYWAKIQHGPRATSAPAVKTAGVP